MRVVLITADPRRRCSFFGLLFGINCFKAECDGHGYVQRSFQLLHQRQLQAADPSAPEGITD